MEYRWDSEWGKRILQILELKTSINSKTGCWEYQGTITEAGYGRVMIDQTQYYVHRLSGMVFHGYRPEYEFLGVLHKCTTKNCWNPDHLYVGTQTDNMQDKASNITHCPQGHPYDEENTRISRSASGGVQRQCKTCVKARTAAWRAKKKIREVS